MNEPIENEDAIVKEVRYKIGAGEDRPDLTESSERMLRVCLRLWAMLDAKNRAYGDSALNPVRIFSKASPLEQIRVRLDDKLSRLARGHAAGEDVEVDFAGYAVILLVARVFGA